MSCYNPHYSEKIKDSYGRLVPIPCRVCESCRNDRYNQWKERCNYEFSKYRCGAFVTFTYDEEHLPYAEGSFHPTLDYLHFHRFIDSIRHRAKKKIPADSVKFVKSRPDFKYFAVGEYGDKFERPHYHCVFFGLDFYECADFLKRSWKYGAIQVKPLKPGAIGYVLKYVQKQVYGPLLQQNYYNLGVLPPKFFISTGLGAGLYYDNQKDFLKYGYIKKGTRQITVPNYYAQKIQYLNEDWFYTIDHIRFMQKYDRWKKYRQFGGLSDFKTWSVECARVREAKLRVKSFKRCKDVSLISVLVNHDVRPWIDELVRSIPILEQQDEIAQYGDLVPF